MNILSITDTEFKVYGRIVDNIDFTSLIGELKNTPVTDSVVYEPSVKALEDTDTFVYLRDIIYGEMPIQIGFCNGHNNILNALEYHKDSEINVMATDTILLLGLRSDMENDFTYNTEKIKAFLVPAGTAVEIYATSLHYAPCGVNGNSFQVAIVLPKGTNYPLLQKHGQRKGENQLLAAVNKWLLVHPEASFAEECFRGLKGENLSVL